MQHWIGGIVLAALALWGQHAGALTFREVEGGRVLLVRDCNEKDTEDRLCQVQKRSEDCKDGGFCAVVPGQYAGDGEQLRRLLKAKRYDAVWLQSGGGHVSAGIDVGLALRQATAKVVVPSNAQCVSACTIAFMGGLIREVIDARSFRVHSSSALARQSADYVSEMLHKYMPAGVERDATKRLDAAWDGLAERQRLRALVSLSELLAYFSDMSNPRGTGREAERQIARIRSKAAGNPVDFGANPLERFVLGNLDMGGRDWRVEHQHLIDEARFEGDALKHRLAMKAERDAYAHVLKRMRASLGGTTHNGWYVPGLDKLDAMYTTTIFDTFDPNPEILRVRGYVTTVVGGAK